MAELLPPIMQANLQDAIVEDLQYIYTNRINGDLYAFSQSHMEEGASFLGDTFGEHFAYQLILTDGGLPNDDLHIDSGIRITCALSSRPDLCAGTIVLPELTRKRKHPRWPVDSNDLVDLRPGIPASLRDSRKWWVNRTLGLMSSETTVVVQPVNGQPIKFNAWKEMHMAPPLPTGLLRLLYSTTLPPSSDTLTEF